MAGMISNDRLKDFNNVKLQPEVGDPIKRPKVKLGKVHHSPLVTLTLHNRSNVITNTSHDSEILSHSVLSHLTMHPLFKHLLS